MKVKFKDYDCELKFHRYANDRVALELVDAEGPVARVTVNLPDADLADGEVFVKDHSENEGMLAAMAAAGVLAPTGRVVASGYVTVPVAKLLVPVPPAKEPL